MRFAALLLVFLLMPFRADAAIDGHDPVYCNENQIQGNECARARYDAADAKMNQLYQEMMGRQDDAGKKHLREAQRAWLTFRDKECAWEAAGWEGGSIQGMMQMACLEHATLDRNTYLQTCVDHEDGCAGPRPFPESYYNRAH